MQYVYVLQSKKDLDFYIGCTYNLKERLRLHNAKKVSSSAGRTSFSIIYYEAFIDKHDTFEREQYLKTGWGRNHLRKTLRNFLNR